VRYLEFCMIILLASLIGCQTDPFKRPIEPDCISNGDGSAECSFQDRTYHEPDTRNMKCTYIESYGRYFEYVLELEERLQKCELSN
jgi:hypothetical protein